MANNAAELYAQMDDAIQATAYVRQSDDAASPQRKSTVEAAPWRSFHLADITHNVPTQRKVDFKWAIANTLHFFANTEDAAPLSKYNRYAERFAPGGRWIGAYGAIAIRQLCDVCMHLREHPESRRAFVTMGGMYPQDINRPACWNYLHFLQQHGKLHMGVSQRSLNLTGVMPYDCVVLTNILNVVAASVRMKPGCIEWAIGSLHRVEGDGPPFVTQQLDTCVLPIEVLSNPEACWEWLIHPEKAYTPWKEMLCGHPS